MVHKYLKSDMGVIEVLNTELAVSIVRRFCQLVS